MSESEFPRNSRREPTPADKPEPKKVEAVVSAPIKRRKKPLGKRFVESFLGDSPKSVGERLVFDVLVPGVKMMVVKTIHEGSERLIFGEVRGMGRDIYRGGILGGGRAAPYNNYSPSPIGRPREVRPNNNPALSPRGRATHDFDEVILPSRAEAQAVLDEMYLLLGKYDVVTVSDLYNLLGISSNFTDEKWGWVELHGTGVSYVSQGYLLNLPRPEPIN